MLWRCELYISAGLVTSMVCVALGLFVNIIIYRRPQRSYEPHKLSHLQVKLSRLLGAVTESVERRPHVREIPEFHSN